jgi:hypothetical protein
MRFMILVKATPETERGVMPSAALFASMAEFHEQLARAGVLLDAAGLQPSARGWRVRYGADQRRVIDGPFAESKELVAGYTLIQTRSRDEALEWTRRFPNPSVDSGVAEIEVRQLYEPEDLEPSQPIEPVRDTGIGRRTGDPPAQ